MGKEERNIYTIQKDESIGEVKIADEVGSFYCSIRSYGGRRRSFSWQA